MTSGSEKRIRDGQLTIRLSETERAAIDAAAERAGVTPGSYARQVLLGGPQPRQVRRPPAGRAELARLLGELGKVGSNLNQLARAANSGKEVYTEEVHSALAGLRLIREAILSALGRGP